MSSLIDLATPGVKRLSPYIPGKPVDELQRELGISQVVKLASNENPLGPSPRALDALRSELGELARYPDGNGFTLKKSLAEFHGIQSSQITLGNGSNDVLELIARGFVTAQHEVIFSQHAFAVYPIVTQAVGATAVVVPAKEWGHDLDAMASVITEKTRLIFIANPNNPTGTWLHARDLENFIAAVPAHVLVVVDEAYFEYASAARAWAGDYPDASQWLEKYHNLIVTRTFSKAYGLAGLRVGYGLSHPEVADVLNRVRQPFNVNSLALCAAQVSLLDVEHLKKAITINAAGMQQLLAGLEKMGLNSIPSIGNFLCVDVGKAALPVYDVLLKQGVIVRPITNYEMPNHLRVTIGMQQENERFLEALSQVL